MLKIQIPSTKNQINHKTQCPIKKDGTTSQFFEERSVALLEEKGMDLAAESARLALIDPAGKGRSSTFRSAHDVRIAGAKPVEIDYNKSKVYWALA